MIRRYGVLALLLAGCTNRKVIVAPNDNTVATGRLAGDTLVAQLVLREGTWFPDDSTGASIDIFGFADGARFKNCLALGLPGHNGWIIRRRLCLETCQKCLLRLVRGVAPLEYVFFPVNSQVSYPAVSLRRLHTRAWQ